MKNKFVCISKLLCFGKM